LAIHRNALKHSRTTGREVIAGTKNHRRMPMLAYSSMTAQNLSTPGVISTLELPCTATLPKSSLRSKARHKGDDAELVERLKTGDEEALEVIFNRYSAKLYTVAQKIFCEVADLEEVIQDVFWTAF